MSGADATNLQSKNPLALNTRAQTPVHIKIRILILTVSNILLIDPIIIPLQSGPGTLDFQVAHETRTL